MAVSILTSNIHSEKPYENLTMPIECFFVVFADSIYHSVMRVIYGALAYLEMHRPHFVVINSKILQHTLYIHV